jgi:hypothetical protein
MGVEGLQALQLGSSALSAYGSYTQGVAEKKAYGVEAQEVEMAGAEKIKEMEVAGEELTSTQRAMYAKAGVRESGSVLEVMLNSATNVEFDKLIEEWNTKVKVDALRYAGAVAKQKGEFQAGMSLLQGSMQAMRYGMKVPT